MVWRFLKKLEIELPYDPAIPLLGIHTGETRSERDTFTPVLIAALFIVAKTWKQSRCLSADEWIRKLWYIYTVFNSLCHSCFWRQPVSQGSIPDLYQTTFNSLHYEKSRYLFLCIFVNKNGKHSLHSKNHCLIVYMGFIHTYDHLSLQLLPKDLAVIWRNLLNWL